jgi:FAD/FMN-containing dehydrogenase
MTTETKGMAASDELLAQMADIVGAPNVLTAGADTAPYLTDWRGRFNGRARAVVRPGTRAEVAAVVAACAKAAVPIVPQGGNTGLVGGATPDRSGDAVLIVLTRLNRVLAADAENNTLTVEAGCTLAAVQEAAAAVGRLFPLSLAAEGSCTIGGNLATNAGGVHVLRYGNARELVLGLEAVLPDGSVLDTLRGLRKDNTGLDLKQLFIGSEGTLGIITAATLKLFPRPTASTTLWLAFDSPAAAVRFFCKLQLRFGARLIAYELLSRRVLDLLFKHFPETRDPLPEAPWAVLAELVDGGEDAALLAAVEDFVGTASQHGEPGDAVIAQSEAQAKALWWLREHVPEAEKREATAIKHDIAVPVSRVPEFLRLAEQSLPQLFPGVQILCFGHLGDGNLHFNLCHCEPGQNPAFLARQDEVNRAVFDLAVSLGGTISAEHGIGQLRCAQLPAYKSAVEMQVMRAVKLALDPRGLMNPGKMLA